MSPTQQLRALYKQGGGWRELFDLLSTYTNRRAQLTAENAVSYTGLAYETIVSLFKELASLGIGTFKFGRRGGKTRLIWKYSPRSIGDAARGKADELEPYDDEDVDVMTFDDDDEAEQPVGDAPRTLKEHLEAAKRDLAEKLGIDPTAVEITIRH